MSQLLEDRVTERILGAAIEVHRELGPGLIESTYEECLCDELRARGVAFDRQRQIQVQYKGVPLDAAYRLDLLVENAVVVELKSVDSVQADHKAQLMTYLRHSGMRVGLLLNFGAPTLKDGIVRMVL